MEEREKLCCEMIA